MRLHIALLASVTLAAQLVLAPPALAVCKGGAPDGKCEPPDDDCACKDCDAACTGGCTTSNPPVCTQEDACTCKDCWSNSFCTNPEKKNCTDNAKCDFFLEGCCCADCAMLEQCAGFDGSCDTGNAGGAGGEGGAGGTGGTAGSSGDGGIGGAPASGGCGCEVVGLGEPIPGGPIAALIGLSMLARRRRVRDGRRPS